MIIPEDWDGKDLPGTWLVTKKLDGVRALSDGRHIMSRKGKPLYGMIHLVGQFADAEIYCGSFKQTISVVRSKNGRSVRPDEVFDLEFPDNRLYLDMVYQPSAEWIQQLLQEVISPGHLDGLVLRQGTRWIRCKPVRTFDVTVIGIQPGQGKHLGRMGALETVMGKVGTGFTDIEREELANCIGRVIEVSCLELTADGKFRHPRFIRLRPDKD